MGTLRIAPQLRHLSTQEQMRAIDDGLAYVDHTGTIVPFIAGSTSYTDAVITTDAALYYWTLNTTSGNENNSGSGGVLQMGLANLTAQNATGASALLGTSWQFNGTTSRAVTSATMTLTSVALLTVEYWMLWDTNANDDDLAMEHTTNYNNSNAFIVDQNSATGFMDVGFSTPTKKWLEKYTRPSAGVWHYYAHVLDRTTPQIKTYVDATLLTPAASTHDAATYGNFDTGNFFHLMHRSGPTLCGAGKMQHVALYTAELSAARVTAHRNIALGLGGSVSRPSRAVTDVRLRR